MSADELRRAADGLRGEWSGGAEPMGTAWHRERDFHLAVADWLDFIAEGRESLDGLAKVRRWLTQNGTSARPPEEPRPPSQLFLDAESKALAVARAYLGADA